MIQKLEQIILELEVKALNGYDLWQQIDKLKQIIKEI